MVRLIQFRLTLLFKGLGEHFQHVYADQFRMLRLPVLTQYCRILTLGTVTPRGKHSNCYREWTKRSLKTEK